MSDAINATWKFGPWTETLTKWMIQLHTPIVATTVSKADLFIGKIPIAIARRDKCALALMIMFREPLAYAERETDTPLAKDMHLDSSSLVFNPEACSLHHDVLLAVAIRTETVCA